MEIKAGDYVKVKIATRSGWIKGWRKVQKVSDDGRVYIRAHGYSDFYVKRCEIEDRSPQKPVKKGKAIDSLAKEDWTEIYYALEDKRNSATVAGDCKWKAHLREIMKKIGPDGENMQEAKP